MTEPRSVRFEKLVARIQHDLSPGAQVRHNERIRGHKTRVLRQIDVTVRTQVGQFPLLIAFECKDLSRPANVNHVEAFAGLLEDIGANKGVLVSARGFTKAAKRRSAEAGIDVYRLVDAEDHDWKTYATIPILFHDNILVKSYFTLHFSCPPESGFEADDFEKVEIYDFDGKSLGSPLDILRGCWNDGGVFDSPGHFKEVPLLQDIALFIRHRRKLYAVKLRAEAWVEQRSYFGRVPLDRISGFRNEISGGVITRSFQTAYLNFKELEKTFQLIDQPSKLAVRPVLEICIQTAIS